MAVNIGVSVAPFSVRPYSTCGGTTGLTSRTTSPSVSNSRRCWISIFSVMPGMAFFNCP